MSHSHSHSHGHGHDHHGHSHAAASDANARRLIVVLCLTAAYAVAEVVGGWFTHSLALLADAGHMLSDVAALGLSLFAVWIAGRPPTARHSYGYYRTEILAAAVNASTLIGISLYVFVEAFRRLAAPPPVHGVPVMLIAAGGFVANIVGMLVLSGGRRDSLNVQGAWLHVATDALGNIGTVIAGALVAYFGYAWADPVASILIGLLVLYSSWSLLRESVGVLMEGVPSGIDSDAVRTRLGTVSGVRAVHDLHIWSITTGLVAMSAHVDVDGSRLESEILPDLCTLLRVEFNIDHATLQLEQECVAEGAMHA